MEYALLLTLVGIIVIVALSAVGPGIKPSYYQVLSQLNPGALSFYSVKEGVRSGNTIVTFAVSEIAYVTVSDDSGRTHRVSCAPGYNCAVVITKGTGIIKITTSAGGAVYVPCP